MRLLVTGAAGQVGRALVSAATTQGHEVFGGYVSRAPDLTAARVVRVDKRDPESGDAAIEGIRPEVVIDTGALHHVDYCEAHPEEAALVNRDGTARLAKVAHKNGSRFVFVSTDYVFDGRTDRPYHEEDPPRPLGVYGRTKWEGEQAVRRTDGSSLIVRPSVIYSWVPPSQRRFSVSQKGVNFGTWAIDELIAGRPIRIVTDQIASPTLAATLAESILKLLDLPNSSGVYHAAGATAIDRFRFTVRLAERLGLPRELVQPVRTAELGQAALRPANSSLDPGRWEAETGARMPSLDESLDRLASEYGRPA